jgi:hypothetical protein
MTFLRVLRIVVLLAIPFFCVYVIAPAIRARGGQTTLFWTGVALLAFGIVAVLISRLPIWGRRSS